MRIALVPGARMVLREEMLLGRHGERPGDFTSRLRVTHGDRAAGSIIAVDPSWSDDPPPPAVPFDRNAALTPLAGPGVAIGVITNDIYTDEDAQFLKSEGVLPEERIRAVETGSCPHTAIRDDVTMNLMAVEDMERDFAPLDIVLVESGGDNLTATFSPALVDAQLFVLDVAGGGDVARKGGPGIARVPTPWKHCATGCAGCINPMRTAGTCRLIRARWRRIIMRMTTAIPTATING
ncbi:hypothetical protein MN186_10215 [Aliiroseovarius sp. N1F302]|uniref:GTP-binding protein n=2 Tax=Aliiroseovarius TaxID=1658781 RepID=UPI001F56BE6A|nr:hypothetical protein [Aliiroseovarius sediminis]